MPPDQQNIHSEERFRAVFESYRRMLLGFFGRRGFSSEDSRDLTQETFVSVYKGLEGVRAGEALPKWIFTVATNIYRNELRRRATAMRQATVLSLDSEDGGGRVADRIHDGQRQSLERLLEDERNRLLHDAVSALPARMRQCVLLRIDQDLKYREIGNVLGISIETVKVQLFQARQRLRAALGEQLSGIDFGVSGDGSS